MLAVLADVGPDKFPAAFRGVHQTPERHVVQVEHPLHVDMVVVRPAAVVVLDVGGLDAVGQVAFGFVLGRVGRNVVLRPAGGRRGAIILDADIGVQIDAGAGEPVAESDALAATGQDARRDAELDEGVFRVADADVAKV